MNAPQSPASTSLFDAPLWLVGFRPFFILAFLAGALLPVLWAASYSNLWQLPRSGLSPTQWHVHEMLFGFGWAVLGGFLLTASKNWVNIRGLHGVPLFVAALLWIIERIVVAFFPVVAQDTSWLTLALSYLGANIFLVYVAGYVLWTLIRYRKQDSFKDNYFFMIALPLFLTAKIMLLIPDTYVHGYSLSIGLFRIAFVVMFERTMTQFMKNALGIALLRHHSLDLSIKILVLLSAFASFLPAPLATLLLAAASALLLVRFCLWNPIAGLSRFDTGTMYVGYFGLTLHLAFEALRLSGALVSIGTLSTHIFTFLCMGIIIPSMMIRICQGHTGRKILFTTSDRIALTCMGIGAFFRLIATQVWPDFYPTWIGLSAIGWSACFILIGARLLPFLWQPRVDGRTH